jgi:hypothetical protein
MDLLQLPAEIRNYIFEFALTDSSSPGLQYREVKINDAEWKHLLIASHGKPCNTLKHSCRQLLSETAGLELKYNALLFRRSGNSDHTPTWKLHRFTTHASDAELTHLQSIIIEKSGTGSREQFENLVRWCSTHPKVMVKYVFPGARFVDTSSNKTAMSSLPQDVSNWTEKNIESAIVAASKFLTFGMIYANALDRSYCTASEWTRLGFDAALRFPRQIIVELGDMWIYRSGQRRDVKVPNLSFWPDESEIDKVRKEALRCLANKSGVGEEVWREWVILSEGWVKEGI